VNYVFETGRITKEPEVIVTEGGTTIAIFSIAVGHGDDVDFFPCKSFNNTAEFLKKYGRKGGRYVFEGRLKQEKWEKDGEKHSRTIVIVNHVEFADSKNRDTETRPESKPDADGFVKVPEGIEEELPFA
jgi:single-strand DNA-binding protein